MDVYGADYDAAKMYLASLPQHSDKAKALREVMTADVPPVVVRQACKWAVDKETVRRRQAEADARRQKQAPIWSWSHHVQQCAADVDRKRHWNPWLLGLKVLGYVAFFLLWWWFCTVV